MKLGRLITRRRAKWVGLVVCVCLAAVMVASNWYVLVFVGSRQNSRSLLWASIDPGAIFLWLELEYQQPPPTPLFRWYVKQVDAYKFGRDDPPYAWLPRYFHSRSGYPQGDTLTLPLWIPLLLTALPTAILFYRGRKPKPGHCKKCRYNLAGLKDNRGPECGTEITQAIKSTPTRAHDVN